MWLACLCFVYLFRVIIERKPYGGSPMSVQSQVLVMAASTRTGSLNQALAALVAAEIDSGGDRAVAVDLRDYELPLYNGDLEAAEGVPGAAKDLVVLAGEAKALVLVSPEYNGAFPPLLKNTVDWMTRLDMRVLAPLTVGLASASPGRGGGARGLNIIRQWMGNMSVNVLDEQLTVPSATLNDDGALVGADEVALAALVAAIKASERTPTDA